MDSGDSGKPWLLCIGAGPEQEGGIIAAKKLGYSVLAIDFNSNAAGFALADEYRVIDIKDKAAILAVSRQFNIAGVIPVPLGRYLTSVGYINDALKLTGPPERTCYLCTDKAAFYNAVQGQDILVPRQLSFNDLDKARRDFKIDGALPFLVKPTHGSGSRGVQVIRKPADWYELNDEAYRDGILIENFIVGETLGVDGWVKDGNVTLLCVRKKKLTPLPYRVEYAYGAPAMLHAEVEKKLTATIENAVKAIGLQNGVFHGDLILDESGNIWLIEMAPRPSGLMISRNLVERATGISLLEIGLYITLDLPFDVSIKNNGSFVLQYIIFNDTETIARDPGFNCQSETAFLIEYKPGPLPNITSTPANMSDIINNGYFIVTGDDLDMAFENADNFLTKIKA